MKNVEQSPRSSKRSRGDATTTSGTMLATKETFMDSITTVDPVVDAEDVDPTIAPLLALRAMMQSIMTTLAAHGQLLDECFSTSSTLFTFGNT